MQSINIQYNTILLEYLNRGDIRIIGPSLAILVGSVAFGE